MLKMILKIISVALIALSSAAICSRDAQMFRQRHYVEEIDYNTHRVHGYNLQPEIPVYWVRECGSANHACVGYHGREPIISIRPLPYTPDILRDRR